MLYLRSTQLIIRMAKDPEIEKKFKIMKLKLGIRDKEIAEWFGYKAAQSFQQSDARSRVISGIVTVYEKATGEVL